MGGERGEVCGKGLLRLGNMSEGERGSLISGPLGMGDMLEGKGEVYSQVLSGWNEDVGGGKRRVHVLLGWNTGLGGEGGENLFVF